ncbi:MAG: hypothetical protein ABIY51_13505 [Ferruginibacter sp.]
MKRQKLKFSLRLIQGAIGKKFVIKHYKWGIIQTRYSDMSKIIASAEQRKCRDLFKEAVAFARTVLADDVLRERWEKRLRKKYRIFNAVIKEYMLMEKRAMQQRVIVGTRIIRNSFKQLAPDGYQDESSKVQPAMVGRDESSKAIEVMAHQKMFLEYF